MSRMKRKQRKEEVYFKSVTVNQTTMEIGPTKKKWTLHDLNTINPITEPQYQMFQQYYQGDNLVAYGSPGTGKSLVALFLAISDVLNPEKPANQLIIVRSAVATRDQGYLKGSLEEKQTCFEKPYIDIFTFLFGRTSTYEDMKKAGLIQFMTTSYIRGLTWDGAVIVVDEVNNMNFHEISSVATRLGDDSNIIFCGDFKQTDLLKNCKDVCGMGQLVSVANAMDEMSLVEFTADDIVRSNFVKSWIIASERVS